MRRLMTAWALLLCVLIAATAATSASAASFTARSLSDGHVGQTKLELNAQIAYSTRIVKSLTSSRSKWMIASRHASCWDHVPWSRLCNRARLKLHAHRWLSRLASKRLDEIEIRELLRGTSTYLGAVAYVERYYGPQPFLRNCPDGEGGFGEWVYIGHASYAVFGPDTTPGGWLQFMRGTFNGIIDRAIAHARARGMYVPVTARDWFSALGQALAGRQMIEDGRRGEWTGRNC